MGEVTREDFIANQSKHCEETQAPFFMPRSGICWNCKRDIIPKLISKGETGNCLITGCPLCYRSYCD
ncbi:hypothetical protein LCGC14_1599530 [marine sediment metagenome]|uniref:Uncharacterized protein n=1 Tax=marine sediment metagenome TaxID=412755 RepID=A0A0F9KSB9_9ZZZZ